MDPTVHAIAIADAAPEVRSAYLRRVMGTIGLGIYASSERHEFSMLRAGLAATFIPMLILMAVSFAFPNLIGGTAGLLVSGLFVLISAAGLLYQLNLVLHEFSEDMPMEGAY